MTSIIAKVRLGANRVGYFDEITRIHLSAERPEAHITSAMNTVNIKRAVHDKVLHLVSGSLGDISPKVPEFMKRKEQAKAEVQVKAEVKNEAVKEVEATKEVEAVKEEPAPEEAAITDADQETSVEDAVEEVETENESATEEPKPRKGRRRKNTEETTE